MEDSTMLRKKILKLSKTHNKTLKSIEKQLKKLPNGSFFSCKKGKTTNWYYRDNGKQIYIPKSNRSFAEQLAYKKYLMELHQDLLAEQKAAEAYLKHHTTDIRRSDQLLTNPAYQELLSIYFKPSNQELIDWMNEPYKQNTLHPESLIHKTVSGNIVRSKSEMLIDMALYKNKIPFRYECPVELSGTTYHPDFTILSPQTNKLIYWEHFGRMDDPVYAQKAYQKLQIYTANGIIPMHNLITTFETKEYSLSSETIEKIIEQYFLI